MNEQKFMAKQKCFCFFHYRPALFRRLIAWPLISIAFLSGHVSAEISNDGVMDNILQRYYDAVGAWADIVVNQASWLFWVLASISLTWTFGLMAVRRADLGEFFAEFIRFTTFTGFFWWLLTNGPKLATDILSSLKMIGYEAVGAEDILTPSSIADIGFDIFYRSVSNSAFYEPSDSLISFFMGMAILISLTLIAVHIVVLLVAGWVLAYGGIFVLGFGGSRWTSDMAINYYKAVLGVAVSLFIMILLIGIGKVFLVDFYSNMSAGLSFKEMSVMMVVSIIILALVSQVPKLVAGIITGAKIGSIGYVGGGLNTAAPAFAGRSLMPGGGHAGHYSLSHHVADAQKIAGTSALADLGFSQGGGAGQSANIHGSFASAMGGALYTFEPKQATKAASNLSAETEKSGFSDVKAQMSKKKMDAKGRDVGKDAADTGVEKTSRAGKTVGSAGAADIPGAIKSPGALSSERVSGADKVTESARDFGVSGAAGTAAAAGTPAANTTGTTGATGATGAASSQADKKNKDKEKGDTKGGSTTEKASPSKAGASTSSSASSGVSPSAPVTKQTKGREESKRKKRKKVDKPDGSRPSNGSQTVIGDKKQIKTSQKPRQLREKNWNAVTMLRRMWRYFVTRKQRKH